MVNQGLSANLPEPGLSANLPRQEKFLPLLIAAAAVGSTGIAGFNAVSARKDKKKAEKEAKRAKNREEGSSLGSSISDLIEKLTIERAQSGRRRQLLSAFMAATGGQRFGFPGAPNRGGA